MALPICTLSFCCSSYVTISKPTMYSLASCSCSSYSLCSPIKTLNFPHFSLFSQVGLFQFTPWNGLRHVGISISPKVGNFGRRNKVKGKVVYASLFGVGAPEALVIGVVALLVFGPKGLAEVARNLGKTLRAFQPTIKELQEVSREFKNTLEREISLDDDPYSTSNTYRSNSTNTLNQSVSSTENSQTVSGADPNGTPSNNAYSSEEYLKITEEQLKAYSAAQEDSTSSPSESQNEIVSQSQDSNPPNDAYSSDEQLKASATTKQDFTSSPAESQTEAESQPQATIQETAVAAPQIETPENET